ATRQLAGEIQSGVQAFGRSGVQEETNDQRPTTNDRAAPPERPNARTPERLNAPSGTVTFLLTDIEGSTAQWGAPREAWSGGDVFRTALASHHTLLREEFRRHGGFE